MTNALDIPPEITDEIALLGEPDRRLPDWLPTWYLRIDAELDAMTKRVKENTRILLRSIERRRQALRWKWGEEFKNCVDAAIVAQGGLRKSVTYHAGRAGYRTKKATIRVADEARLLKWLYMPDHRDIADAALEVKLARITPIIEYITGTGDIPPGVEFVPEREEFYPDIRVDGRANNLIEAEEIDESRDA